MKRRFSFLVRPRPAIAVSLALLVMGGFFRWEVRQVDDAATGVAVSRYRGLVFPWQPCGVRTGGSRRINFHVTHWLAYGLVRVEATGQTY
jgi:hypothetical protein